MSILSGVKIDTLYGDLRHCDVSETLAYSRRKGFSTRRLKRIAEREARLGRRKNNRSMKL